MTPNKFYSILQAWLLKDHKDFNFNALKVFPTKFPRNFAFLFHHQICAYILFFSYNIFLKVGNNTIGDNA